MANRIKMVQGELLFSLFRQHGSIRKISNSIGSGCAGHLLSTIRSFRVFCRAHLSLFETVRLHEYICQKSGQLKAKHNKVPLTLTPGH
jgi:hypothetical protein